MESNTRYGLLLSNPSDNIDPISPSSHPIPWVYSRIIYPAAQ